MPPLNQCAKKAGRIIHLNPAGSYPALSTMETAGGTGSQKLRWHPRSVQSATHRQARPTGIAGARDEYQMGGLRHLHLAPPVAEGQRLFLRLRCRAIGCGFAYR